jgi:cytochrome c oxidase cbb3-type subunit 1
LATGKEPGAVGLTLHFWMAVVGSFIYVISLSVGGTLQGLDWKQGSPFIQSVVDMQSYWVWRGVGGSLLFLCHLAFGWNVWHMTFGVGTRAPSQHLAPAAESAE